MKSVLFITSFFPVIVFKIVARVGDASLTQAKIALVLGLILGIIQFTLSKHFLKQTSYLERSFLGFLVIGTALVFLTPPSVSTLFVNNSTALLYFVLFLTTLLPQLFGYDPFTYAIAKQWYPEPVWNTPQFRPINLHITYFWSGVFFLAFISSWLGHGKPVYSIVIPLILILGLGLSFSKLYPNYYLKREFPAASVDLSLIPTTARELISWMLLGFDAKVGKDLGAEIQFDLSGEGGGKMVLSISDGHCTYREGETTSPTLTIRSSADTWLKIARGEINGPKAFMDGLFTVEGDMNLLMRMGELFRPPPKKHDRP